MVVPCQSAALGHLWTQWRLLLHASLQHPAFLLWICSFQQGSARQRKSLSMKPLSCEQHQLNFTWAPEIFASRGFSHKTDPGVFVMFCSCCSSRLWTGCSFSNLSCKVMVQLSHSVPVKERKKAQTGSSAEKMSEVRPKCCYQLTQSAVAMYEALFLVNHNGKESHLESVSQRMLQIYFRSDFNFLLAFF